MGYHHVIKGVIMRGRRIAWAAALLIAASCSGIRTWSSKVIAEDETGESLLTEAPGTRHDWEIVTGGGGSREYIATNKVATHFSCETNRRHSRSYHGLYCAMHEYLDSWEFQSGGELLNPDEVGLSRAYPHTLYRWYEDKRIIEEIMLPDVENGMAVRFAGLLGDTCSLIPWVDMRFIWDAPRPEYRIFWEKRNNTLLISRVDNPFEPGRPRWIAIRGDLEMEFEPDERFEERIYPKDAARRAMAKTSPFTPGRFTFSPEKEPVREVVFAIGLGVTEGEAAHQAERILGRRLALKAAKIARIDWIVNGRSPVEQPPAELHGGMRYAVVDGPGGRAARPAPGAGAPSLKLQRSAWGFGGCDVCPPVPEGSERSRKAYRWARASMDNLIMNQRGRGIYAGFHWFPNYWGRDSFICLPGACIATGEYPTAREILTSFMEYQQTDPGSERLGRMPNIVSPDNLQYAGVDGTWWFVRAAWKYYRASGDAVFLLAAWPRIRLAIEGALEKAVDHRGFLTHGDGETWMDAGGEHNPYSPRGDRAVEIQALFHHGLIIGASWARTVAALLPEVHAAGDDDLTVLIDGIDPGELHLAADGWMARAAMLAQSFRSSFWWGDRRYLRDHLNEDGTADDQIRPNALLALFVYLDTLRLGATPAYAELVTWIQMREIVGTAMETVILPHGVTSLDPADPGFKPLHLDLDNYYYDAAYHNGDVWVWLAGPAIRCMMAVGEEQASRDLFAPMVDEILEKGCVGSLREIRDGVYIEGKEEFGGATSQAWSLAEFIRVSLEDLPAGMQKRRRGTGR
jgi:hypothetical protein